MTKSMMMAAATAMLAVPCTVQAEGLGAEAAYGRADGRWGTEVGAGYGLDIGAFKLTPGAGVFIRDGGTRAYGRAEATFTLPAFATVGVGVRVSDERTRPYATISYPIFPKVAIKGNAWPKYVSLGLTLGY